MKTGDLHFSNLDGNKCDLLAFLVGGVVFFFNSPNVFFFKFTFDIVVFFSFVSFPRLRKIASHPLLRAASAFEVCCHVELRHVLYSAAEIVKALQRRHSQVRSEIHQHRSETTLWCLHILLFLTRKTRKESKDKHKNMFKYLNEDKLHYH